MNIDALRLVRTFQDLVAIDSPSFREGAMAAEVRARLEGLGLTVREDGAARALNGESGNLFTALPGAPGLPPLLLCAHMDTVEPARGKRAVVDPDGTIRSAGDTVLGADDLAAVAAILEVLRVLKEGGLPHRSAELLFTVAEEPYCRGANAFDFSQVTAREAYVFDCDAPMGAAVTAAPTILQFSALVTGRAAHAGFAPEEGLSAIAVAAQALSHLTWGRISPTATLNFGLIEGGLATNIVPDRCLVRGEIRSTDHREALDLADGVRLGFRRFCGLAGAGLEFTQECPIQAYRTPEDAPVVRRYRAVCEELGLPYEAITSFGGSDNNVLAQQGITGIVCASAMHRCHTCGEYSTVAELTALAELILRLLTRSE